MWKKYRARKIAHTGGGCQPVRSYMRGYREKKDPRGQGDETRAESGSRETSPRGRIQRGNGALLGRVSP